MSDKKKKLTVEEVEAERTPKGGWTKKTLESWGVPWPPPKGWKDELTKIYIDDL